MWTIPRGPTDPRHPLRGAQEARAPLPGSTASPPPPSRHTPKRTNRKCAVWFFWVEDHTASAAKICLWFRRNQTKPKPKFIRSSRFTRLGFFWRALFLLLVWNCTTASPLATPNPSPRLRRRSRQGVSQATFQKPKAERPTEKTVYRKGVGGTPKVAATTERLAAPTGFGLDEMRNFIRNKYIFYNVKNIFASICKGFRYNLIIHLLISETLRGLVAELGPN